MSVARLLAPNVGDPDRRRSVANSRAAAAVITVLLIAVAAGALSAAWSIWLGFAAGAVALLGAGANLRGVFGGPGSPASKAPATKADQLESTRVTRLLQRGRPIPAEDAELADTVARQNLRSLGLSLWTGPLVASGQLGALPLHHSDDVFRLLLLMVALALGLGSLVITVRFRRGLLDPNPG